MDKCISASMKSICPRAETWKTAITRQKPPVLYRDGEDLSVDAIQFVSSLLLWANLDRCLATMLLGEPNRYTYRDQCIACTAQTSLWLSVGNAGRSQPDDPTVVLKSLHFQVRPRLIASTLLATSRLEYSIS